MNEFKKLVYTYLRKIYDIDKAPDNETAAVTTMKSLITMGIVIIIIYAYTHHIVDGALGVALDIVYWFTVIAVIFGGTVVFFAVVLHPVTKHNIPSMLVITMLLEPQTSLNSKVYTVVPSLMSIISTFYETKWMLENDQFYVPLLWVFITLAMLVARYKTVKAHNIIEHTIDMVAQKGREDMPEITQHEMNELAKGAATLIHKQVTGVLLEQAERETKEDKNE